MNPDDDMTHDLTTTLRSELAALEYKRDRLMSEVNQLSILFPLSALSCYQFNISARLAPGDEEHHEIAGSEDRGITGGS